MDFTQRAQAIERPAFGKRRQQGDAASAIGNLNRFPSPDSAKQFAGLLPKLTDPDRRHVLLIAHLAPFACSAGIRVPIVYVGWVSYRQTCAETAGGLMGRQRQPSGGATYCRMFLMTWAL